MPERHKQTVIAKWPITNKFEVDDTAIENVKRVEVELQDSHGGARKALNCLVKSFAIFHAITTANLVVCSNIAIRNRCFDEFASRNSREVRCCKLSSYVLLEHGTIAVESCVRHTTSLFVFAYELYMKWLTAQAFFYEIPLIFTIRSTV